MKLMKETVFTVGQKVACHHPDGYSLGEVAAVDANHVTAVVKYHQHQEDGSTTEETSVRQFVRREKDGLFVSPASLRETRPRWMLSSMENSVACWKWRKNESLKTKLAKSLRGARILLRWAMGHSETVK
jgi:hypothetical protein